MFFSKQPDSNKQVYAEILEAMGSLSNLFADTPAPYLNYRATENILCRAFNAKNLARSDCSADAIKDNLGIGIKTFLNGNGRTLQKIAEFNKSSHLYRGKRTKEIINIIANLRNERIKATKRIHGIDSIVYHCITREPGKIKVFECNMDEISIAEIKNIKSTKNTIAFEDSLNEYTFNLSKSTLYKRFYTDNVLLDIDVEIIENPYDIIRKLLIKQHIKSSYMIAESAPNTYPIPEDKEHIFLPLYSVKNGKKFVPERSNLNQWNAQGRSRHYNEIYIRIPSWIHKVFPNFFPPRDQSFQLILPDGNILSAKVCQDNSKALMTNPNKDLGNWLLRQVMNLNEGELLTYNKLEQLDIDSVVIYKEQQGIYTIDFTSIDSFENFQEKSKYNL